jgi:hypothetical protein
MAAAQHDPSLLNELNTDAKPMPVHDPIEAIKARKRARKER